MLLKIENLNVFWCHPYVKDISFDVKGEIVTMISATAPGKPLFCNPSRLYCNRNPVRLPSTVGRFSTNRPIKSCAADWQVRKGAAFTELTVRENLE